MNPRKITFSKAFVAVAMVVGPSVASAQLGVDYNQSAMPFAGISYELKERFRPEVRIGTDRFFEDMSLEGVLTYDILNNIDYEFYGGLGIRTGDFNGLVIPIGLNLYPLTTKQFGLQIELTPIIGESDILRGSLGVHYRFKEPANSKE